MELGLFHESFVQGEGNVLNKGKSYSKVVFKECFAYTTKAIRFGRLR